MANNILFIGGTGIISSAVSPLVVARGDNLFVLNRGISPRGQPAGARLVQADIRTDPGALAKAIAQHKIDVVVDWIAFVPEQVQGDIDACLGRVKQYVFISSASAYQKPIRKLPITEETPLENPFWEYSRNKAKCEQLLMEAYRKQGFPVTIVRPSHTYDKTLFPFHGGYTVVDRMRKGKPVIVHGDGTSLWVMTHHQDFAVGFTGLLGNPAAVGEIFHITSDELLTWNAIFGMIAEAAGAELHAIHVPSELIAKYDADWGASLLGDKAHSVIFDNSKIKRVVPEFNPRIPFAEGVREVMAWVDGNPAAQLVDEKANALYDKIIIDFGSLGK
ncbi:MAG: NAD-dependent epimerase/dehydratase family protein [Anaerolineales bacterium]